MLRRVIGYLAAALTLIAAAGVAALALPVDGRSHVVLVAVAVGYVLTALVYTRVSRPHVVVAPTSS